MRKVSFSFFFFLSIAGMTQNLVLNPSFEDRDSNCCTYCSSASSIYPIILMLSNWKYLNYPKISDNADYYSGCLICNPIDFSLHIPPHTIAGYLLPHSGNSYIGMFLFSFPFHLDTATNELIYSDSCFAEYIQGKLSQNLIAGNSYKISVYASLSDRFHTSANCLSVCFSDTIESIQEEHVIRNPLVRFNEFIDQKNDFVKYESSFIAISNSLFFSIGNFISEDNIDTMFVEGGDLSWYRASYILIDDVAIYPADAPVYAADAGGDQLLCKGESATLGSQWRSQYLYWWYDAQGNLIDTTAQITVSPYSTTFYVLQQKDFKFDETSDTVIVYVSDCESPLYIPNIFSPNSDGNNDIFCVRGEGISEIKTFVIYNRWGEEVFSCRTSTPLSAASNECGWDGTYRGEPVPQAVYTYYVEAVLLNGETVVKRGNVTLVR